MKPQPWSFTVLNDFKNCPRQYYEKRVLKRYKEERTEQQIWGEQVHKAFELRQRINKPLPPHLEEHEEIMRRLEEKPGDLFVEEKAALNRQVQPCDFFADDVWFRGVIDFAKVDLDRSPSIATLVDYKTGKVKNQFDQLELFALYAFARWPVEIVNVQFYWTMTRETTKMVIGREEIPEKWKKFIPDLKQFAQAFKTETWQPRQSGLCNGWCPVKTCEFWKPKRTR